MKHVIWDWNGTLLDDLDECLEVTNRLLTNHGKEPFPDVSAYRHSFFFPVPAWYRSMGFRDEDFSTLAKEYMDDYMAQPTKLHPDVMPVLEDLKARGFAQTILSASSQENLEKQVLPFGLPVTDLVGQTGISAKSKLETAVEYVSRFPDGQFVFVGDSVHDFEVAKACQADCILVNTGHQCKSALLATGAPVVDSLTEVEDLLCSKL